MCGIVGLLDKRSGFSPESGEALVRSMAEAIAHRGPDGQGAYVEAECGLALGHRRLAIIDLTEAGAQPMRSADGRWVITYNGEIYNFEEMRSALEQAFGQRAWRGHSDTEVLVETVAALGVEEALRRTNGMFALAIWDRQERALYLARDRMGEKPLYYGWAGDAFLFGSELKALAVHPKFRRDMDRGAMSLFLQYGYVPNPLCIYRGFAQLEPGHFVRLAFDAAPGQMPQSRPYWDLPEPKPEPADPEEAEETLDRLLRDATRLRMRADVPMGAFLSGGIDSSTVVALMQAQSSDRVRTYSIGFSEAAYDEAGYAKDVAKHLGTLHTEMYVSSDDARDLIPAIPTLYDEPFADSSQLPTYLLCKLTRQHVTVSLSGDAGDELFGGYERYFTFSDRWPLRRRLRPVRPLVAGALDATPALAWQAAARIAPARIRGKITPQRAKRLAASVRAATGHDYYRHLMEQWSPNTLRRPPAPRRRAFLDRVDIDHCGDPFLGMTYADMGSYLPDDILVKVDRASMAVSLESRVPLLDHRIVEYAATLPLDLKRRGRTGKWLLRQVLDRYVPQALIDRPKQGFGAPIKEWFRGPLRAWGEDLLNDHETVVSELVDLSAARDVWREHQTSDADHSYRLWTVLMLMAWAREWRPQ